jgi:16S rRNA (uracil1498-N3)-methyltransferase
VLRSRSGDVVYISDNKTYRYKTEILEVGKSEALLTIKDKKRIAKELPQLMLFQCVLKKNSMEFVIQKATEIGVDRIIPVMSSRVIADGKKISGKVERWQKISDGASKQSKRDFKCEVAEPEDIYRIKVSEYGLFYVPYEESSVEYENIAETFKNEPGLTDIAFIIGPEGGFETKEVEFLKKSGAREIRLGKNIYRSETAAIYFLSVLDYLIRNQK